MQRSVNYDPFKKPLVKGKENENWVEAAAAVLKAGAALPGYKVLAVNASTSTMQVLISLRSWDMHWLGETNCWLS